MQTWTVLRLSIFPSFFFFFFRSLLFFFSPVSFVPSDKFFYHHLVIVLQFLSFPCLPFFFYSYRPFSLSLAFHFSLPIVRGEGGCHFVVFLVEREATVLLVNNEKPVRKKKHEREKSYRKNEERGKRKTETRGSFFLIELAGRKIELFNLRQTVVLDKAEMGGFFFVFLKL